MIWLSCKADASSVSGLDYGRTIAATHSALTRQYMYKENKYLAFCTYIGCDSVHSGASWIRTNECSSQSAVPCHLAIALYFIKLKLNNVK